MPVGVKLSYPQQTSYINSALAEEEIPQRKLWLPGQALPSKAVNAPVVNAQASPSGVAVNNPVEPAGRSITEIMNQNNATIGEVGADLSAQNLQLQKQLTDVSATQLAATSGVGTQVSGLQTVLTDLTTGPGTMFGFQQIADAIQGIWNWSTSQNYFSPSVNWLNNAGAAGAAIMSQILWRLETSTSFLVCFNFFEGSGGFPDVENLNLAQASDKPSGTSPLAYLNGVLPAYDWQENHLGTGLVGMSFVSAIDSVSRDYFWSPIPPSLDDIFHLWDYTPSSGPPQRNGITDFISVLTLLPVQF